MLLFIKKLLVSQFIHLGYTGRILNMAEDSVISYRSETVKIYFYLKELGTVREYCSPFYRGHHVQDAHLKKLLFY